MKVSHRLLPILALGILAIANCDDKEEGAPSLDASPKALPSAAPLVMPSASTSWTMDQFAQLGMPPVDRVWRVEDYRVASKLILELAGRSPEQLPRMGAGSEAILTRYTSLENLRELEKTKSGAEGIVALAQILEQTWPVLNLYMIAAKLPKGLTREFFALSMFSLDLVSSAFSLADGLIPTMDAKDPAYVAMLNGLEQSRFGAVQMVLGAITILSEANWTIEDRVFLTVQLQRVLPVLMGRFSSQSQAAMTRRLGAIGASEKNPMLKKALKDLVEKLRTSAQPVGSAGAKTKSDLEF